MALVGHHLLIELGPIFVWQSGVVESHPVFLLGLRSLGGRWTSTHLSAKRNLACSYSSLSHIFDCLHVLILTQSARRGDILTHGIRGNDGLDGVFRVVLLRVVDHHLLSQVVGVPLLHLASRAHHLLSTRHGVVDLVGWTEHELVLSSLLSTCGGRTKGGDIVVSKVPLEVGVNLSLSDGQLVLASH